MNNRQGPEQRPHRHTYVTSSHPLVLGAVALQRNVRLFHVPHTTQPSESAKFVLNRKLQKKHHSFNLNTQEVKNERFLIWTRQNNVRIFGKCCLRQSDAREKLI